MKFTQVLSARRRFWAWPLPFLLTAGGGLRPAVAAERISRPYAAHVPWTLLWQAEEPVEIPVGETVQAVTLTPPPLPILPHRRGTEGISTGPILGLRFRARLHTERPAGWNNYLGLKVNGLPLGTFTSQRRPRLLNRRGYFVAQWHGETKHSFWVDRAGLPCLQVFFGPNWDTLEERLLSEREEGYWYLLEVSDVFRTEGPNTLELVNTAIASYWQGNPPPGLRLVVDALALGAIPQEAVEELRGQQLQRRRKLPGEQLTNERCTVTVVGGGGDLFRRIRLFRARRRGIKVEQTALPADGFRGTPPSLYPPAGEGKKGDSPRAVLRPAGAGKAGRVRLRLRDWWEVAVVE